ncbi:hypothetical protein VP01_6902g1, partial [Puccinia sorghi]
VHCGPLAFKYYTQQFNIHTYNSAWSANILVSLYPGGLKENIQLAIVSLGKVFPTFPKIQALAMQLVNKLETNHSHTFKISPPTHSTTATSPNAMDLSAMKGRLSDSERKKMMQASQCFQCRQVGHKSQDCPKKKNPGQSSRPILLADLQIIAVTTLTFSHAAKTSTVNHELRFNEP